MTAAGLRTMIEALATPLMQAEAAAKIPAGAAKDLLVALVIEQVKNDSLMIGKQ